MSSNIAVGGDHSADDRKASEGSGSRDSYPKRCRMVEVDNKVTRRRNSNGDAMESFLAPTGNA